MRLSQYDAYSVLLLPNVQDHGPDALSGVVRLAGNLLASREDRHRAPQVYRERPAFIARDRSRYDLTYALRVFIENRSALVLADLLDHDLLGGLRGDPAQRFHVDGLALVRSRDFARKPVDDHYAVFRRTEALVRGGDHREFEILEDAVLVDVLVATDRVNNAQ